MSEPLYDEKKYQRWMYKKFGDRFGPMELLQRRAAGAAMLALDAIRDVPYERLSSSLYFLCADLEAERFAHRYEAQLELAGADADKFIKGAHKFFNETERYIRENELYADYFDFAALALRLRTQPSDKVERRVADAYVSLLLQQAMYLGSSKFDNTKSVCGMTTGGELMTVPDPFPRLDVPGYIAERAILCGTAKTKDDYRRVLTAAIRREDICGIQTPEAWISLTNVDRMYTNHRVALAPFVNEYTFDIFPLMVFNGNVTSLLGLVTAGPSNAALTRLLERRNKTLPANGAVFRFREGTFFRELLLREVLYDDSIYMLYKASTDNGELGGYYDTKDHFFYSTLSDADDKMVYENFVNVILYCYACAVLNDGPRMLRELPELFRVRTEDGLPVRIGAELFFRGGKMKSTYGEPRPDAGHEARAGNEKYESVERALSGFVRKVGAGKTPSKEAVAYAESIGLYLAPDETYVRPFTKHVLRLRGKERQT